ncbi:hypothetical protein [Tabrizicola fusiformis]|uniref:hypothetical protein n=1 Tax=Tabrizicola sp. SY72 TaxID=2741673 RepID=UPI0015726096|nr:hypothetical protein [Tabrizicola sp. SY72]NTT87204.1 hypothetical protein [Tabrizicola sp. SY72]
MPKTIRFPAVPVGLSAMAEPFPVKPGKPPHLAVKGKAPGKHAAPVARQLEVPGKGRGR